MTDKNSAVLIERRGAISMLSINRPHERNTLTLNVLLALKKAIEEFARSPELRALVLTGEGRDFSLGGDHQDFENALALPPDESRKYCRERTQLLSDVIIGLYSLPVPVIAVMSGQSSGAGISLALACDLRIMEARAKLNIAYGTIGASTDGGMSWFLPQYLGESVATELLFLQPIIRAPRALELGLIHEVWEMEQLIPRAIELAETLANSAPHSIRGAKRMLRSRSIPELRQHLHVEHEQFIDGLATSDFRSAVQAAHRGELYSFLPKAE
jgi:2-(1,2-epoxy-1,2-dihydrophenyl)acetyl-CoA isomerase